MSREVVQPFRSKDQENRVVLGGAVGTVHPSEPNLGEVEHHIQKTDGAN